MNRRNVDPSSLSPLVHPIENHPLLCQVHRVRYDIGQNKGALVDCTTLDGDMFCLPGHTTLVNKVELLKLKLPCYLLILPLGKVKAYFDYKVEWLDGTLEEILADPEFQPLYEYTQEYVRSNVTLSDSGV